MPELNSNTFGLIHRIWNAKKWKFTTPDIQESAFNRLCEMFRKLEKNEQGLLLNLMRFYSYYSYTDYHDLLVKAFLKFEDNQINEVDQIIIAPLVKPEDIDANYAKSGHSLIYVANNIAITAHKKLANLERNSIINPYIVSRKELKGEKILVILIDDFVGSGTSASSVYKQVKERFSTNDKIIVTCLITTEKAIARLKSDSIPFYWSEIALKGIADNQFITNKQQAYELIDNIWRAHLDVSKQYKRGYKKSETLITLIRTPNNTLPMFWCKKARDGSDWPSPFTR